MMMMMMMMMMMIMGKEGTTKKKSIDCVEMKGFQKNCKSKQTFLLKQDGVWVVDIVAACGAARPRADEALAAAAAAHLERLALVFNKKKKKKNKM